MRDSLKTTAYFENYIAIQKEVIGDLEQRISIAEDLDKKGTFSAQLMYKHYHILVASYGKGDNFYLLRKIYANLINDFRQYGHQIDTWTIIYPKGKEVIYLSQFTLSVYVMLLDWLSFGINLKRPRTEIQFIAEIIDYHKVKDDLFEYLLSYYIEDRPPFDEESYVEPRYFHINKRYGILKEIITYNDKNKAEKALGYFLTNKWYSSLRGTGMYDNHDNPHNTYTGYWCFVAAAIVKIMGLDDSDFRENLYYPKDMLNFS